MPHFVSKSAIIWALDDIVVVYSIEKGKVKFVLECEWKVISFSCPVPISVLLIG